jgi:hypothetical protein
MITPASKGLGQFPPHFEKIPRNLRKKIVQYHIKGSHQMQNPVPLGVCLQKRSAREDCLGGAAVDTGQQHAAVVT